MMTDPYGQTNPRSVTGAPGAAAPPRIPPAGHFTPRMLLALTAIYNPAILLAWLLYLYGPSNSCIFGGLCSFGAFPGILQLLLLTAGAMTLGAVIFVPLWWLLDENRPARDVVSRTARDMVRFVTIRPLMVCYGLALLLLLIAGLVIHRIQPPVFLLGLASGIICLWCAASPEFTPASPLPPPQSPQSRQPLQPLQSLQSIHQPLQRDRDISSSAFLNDSPPQLPQA